MASSVLTLVTSAKGLSPPVPTVPADAEETVEKGLGEMPGERDENEEKAEKGDASPVADAALPLRNFRFRFFFPPGRPPPSSVGTVGGRGGFDADDRAGPGMGSLLVVWWCACACAGKGCAGKGCAGKGCEF